MESEVRQLVGEWSRRWKWMLDDFGSGWPILHRVSASPNSVTIEATETADAQKASASITLENPSPQIASIAPLTIPIGKFSLMVNGALFASARHQLWHYRIGDDTISSAN